MIRNGTSLGNKPFYNRARLDTDAGSLLETFIMQHYSNHPAPPEIIVSHELENSEILAATLHQLNQSRVRIVHNVRDKRRRALENAVNNARQALQSYLLSASMLSKRYQNLVELLHLENPPERIECFDISHTMGESTKASCVVFGRDGAIKNEYRRYNIKDIQAGNILTVKENLRVALRLPGIARPAPKPGANPGSRKFRGLASKNARCCSIPSAGCRACRLRGSKS